MAGDPHPCVHREHAVGAGDDRVEVELGHLRQVVGEPGDAQQRAAERPEVGGGLAPVAEQQGRGADLVDEIVGVGVGQRREAGGMVAEHLRGDAAEAEHHQRPEHRFLHHPDDGLDTTGDHGLDENPGQTVAEPSFQPPQGAAHVGRAAQAELDRAGVALVHQPGHVGLERHVAAEGGGGLSTAVRPTA